MNNKSIKIAVSVGVLAAEYRAGASIRDLAAKYGCSFQNIHIRLINAGVAMQKPGSTKDIPDKVCPTCGKTFSTYSRNQVFCCMEHVRFKAICKHGHVLTEDTRYHYPGSASKCKQCARRRTAAYKAKLRARQDTSA